MNKDFGAQWVMKDEGDGAEEPRLEDLPLAELRKLAIEDFEAAKREKAAKQKARRAARKIVLDSLGMKQVRGNLGGVYYE